MRLPSFVNALYAPASSTGVTSSKAPIATDGYPLIGPSNHGFDFPRVRVQHNQSGLGSRPVFRILPFLTARGELLFDKRKAIGEGFNGGFLKFWDQRGIDAKPPVINSCSE